MSEVKLYSGEEARLLSVRPGITDFSSIVFSDESNDGTFVDTGVTHTLQALQTLSRRRTVTFLTTHYHQIAERLAADVPHARNLHVVSGRNADGTLTHTYTIAEGHDPALIDLDFLREYCVIHLISRAYCIQAAPEGGMDTQSIVICSC